MNERAKEMGLEDSNFVNTNGLPDNAHYSCAYDIAMISSELMKHEEARKWFTSWQEKIQVGLPGKKSDFVLTNTNKLIKQYDGTIGVKTGYTEDAGYCLSSAAERNGTRMIAVVLDCETSDIRFKEASRLMDYGFANYKAVRVAREGEIVKGIKIEKGEDRCVEAIVDEDIYVTVEKSRKIDIDKEIKLNKVIELPIKKGDELGVLNIKVDGKECGNYLIYASKDINKARATTLFKRLMEVFLN